MKGPVLRIGTVAIVACSVLTQGCLVPYAKYLNLKRKHERATEELQTKEHQLQTDRSALQGLRDQLDSQHEIVKLYQEQKRKAEEAARKAKEQVDAVQRRLDDIARRHGPGVEVGDRMLSIKSTLLFALGKDDISAEGQKLLADVAKEFANTDEIIQVDGHTDDHRVSKRETVKRFKDNWGLSAARANAVLRLLAQSGIPENRMYIRAFSMFRPRVPNTSEANRSKNRRVAVYFLPPDAPAAPAPE